MAVDAATPAPAAAAATPAPAAAAATQQQTPHPADTPATPAPAAAAATAPEQGEIAGFGSPFMAPSASTATGAAAAAAAAAATPATATPGTAAVTPEITAATGPPVTPAAPVAPAAAAALRSADTTATPTTHTAAAATAAPLDPAAAQALALCDETEERATAALRAAQAVLQNLPANLLQYPLRLLAQAGLSSGAYVRASNVLRCVAELAPVHLPALLQELQERVSQLGSSLEQLLGKTAAADPASPAASAAPGQQPSPWMQADTMQLASIATHGACVLRLLHLLQSYRKQATRKDADKAADQAAGDAAAAAEPASTAAAATAPAPMQGVVAAGSAGPSAGEGSGSSSAADTAAAEALTSPACLAAIDAAVAQVATSLEPLWQALSTVISHIEAAISRSGTGEQGAAAAAAAAPGSTAASRQLPAGGQQVMPLVESFFVVCSLQGAVPPAPHQAASGDGSASPQPSLSAAELPASLDVSALRQPSGTPVSRAPSAAQASMAAAAAAAAAAKHHDSAFHRCASFHNVHSHEHLHERAPLWRWATRLLPLSLHNALKGSHGHAHLRSQCLRLVRTLSVLIPFLCTLCVPCFFLLVYLLPFSGHAATQPLRTTPVQPSVDSVQPMVCSYLCLSSLFCVQVR